MKLTNIDPSKLRKVADILIAIAGYQEQINQILGVADQPEPEVQRTVVGWTPERRAKFLRTMRLKRMRHGKSE